MIGSNEAKAAKGTKRGDALKFRPVLLGGLALNLLITAICIVLMAFSFNFFSAQQPGPLFFLSFLIAIGLFVPIGFFAYRVYALVTATYELTRNSLRLRWGLRSETIPLTEINWIRTPAELNLDVPWPFLPTPGAYIGGVHIAEGDEVEFMASSLRTMLFIGTPTAIYGISPRLPSLFMTAYERMLQLGILTEAERQTIQPADWFVMSFRSRILRFSMILSLLMVALLALWLGFRLSRAEFVQFGWTASGLLRDPVPVGNAMILPALSGLSWAINFVAGVRLYRSDELQRTAEILWGSSVPICAFFLLAGFFVV